MPGKGPYSAVKQVIQDLIAPELESIKGELAGVRAELKAVDKRIDSIEKRVDDGFSSLRNEMQAGFRSVDDRIDTLRERVADTNKHLDEALDIRERLAAVEAKLAARG
jgi:chromosome segregation ATPase